MEFVRVLGFLSLFLILYHYLIYPITLLILARIIGMPIAKASFRPSVSLIIAAYNEEYVMESKLLNSLQLDYPKDRLEIIVVSDGSQDRTHSIASGFASTGVISIHSVPRKGKTAALNRALKVAQGEIVCFSDANTMFQADALLCLTRNFADASVGGVSGRKTILQNSSRVASFGDRCFWILESFLKDKQSLLSSIPTADGEIFAVRRGLLGTLPEDMINDDTVITFDLIEKGFRVVYDKEAIAAEEASINLEDDFKVKTRMVYGGWQILRRYHRMLLPPRTLFAWQFLSHKMLRHAMPVLLISLLFSSAVLGGFFRGLFILQMIAYFVAAIGYWNRRKSLPKLVYIPAYYTLMNLAALKGLVLFILGFNPLDTWKKASRI